MAALARFCRATVAAAHPRAPRALCMRMVGPLASRRLLSSQADTPSATSQPGQVVWQLQQLSSEMPESMQQAFGVQNMSQKELNQVNLQQLIQQWQRRPGDTGSGEVQVAVFTERILRLSQHMARHHKDNSSKRRLQLLVLQRNRMLKYLRRGNRTAYTAVVEGLSIRPNKNFDPTIKPKRTKLASKRKRRSGGTAKKARAYGDEKSPKGRTRLQRHAARQRRLQREAASA